MIRKLLIAKFTRGLIYILCSNGSGAFVNREGKLVPLIKTSKEEYLTISGKVRLGDTFLFATHEVIGNLSLDLMSDALSEDGLEDSSKILEPSLELLEESNIAILARSQGLDTNFVVNSTQPLLKTEQQSLRTNAVGFIDKLIDKLPQKKIHIEEADYAFKSKKKFNSTALIGIVLLCVLGVSIYFGLKADQTKKAKAKYEPQLTEAQHNLDEAREIAELSPTRAQELILSAQGITTQLKSDGITDDRLESLILSINENLGPIAGIYSESPQLYLDLSLVASGFEGTHLAFSGDMIRVLDANEKKLVGVEIANKRTKIIAGSDYLPNALEVIAYEDRSFIVSNDGIREVTGDVNLIIKSEWDANNIIARMFAGNMYVLEKSQNQIWRYSGTTGGFLEKDAWLAEGYVPDFSNERSVAIDGTIWTLANGEISNYSLSVATNFSLKGLRGSLDGATKLYTSDETDSLYVLDPQNSRVVVIAKDGQYLGEYSNSELLNAKDFIVSESEKKLIFLSNSKLYAIELRHI